MQTWNPPDIVADLKEWEAVRAGENARIRLELEEAEAAGEIVRESVRHRLGRSLVQLGLMIDPMAADEKDNEEA